jgi:hypothetical protein
LEALRFSGGRGTMISSRLLSSPGSDSSSLSGVGDGVGSVRRDFSMILPLAFRGMAAGPACGDGSGLLGRRGTPGWTWDLCPCLRYTINDEMEDMSS